MVRGPLKYVSKLNCDGFMEKSTSKALAWGILRDHCGHAGIQIAWNRGSKKLIVESDYLISISLLMHECPTFHNCFSLIHNIHEFVLDRGEVQWSHTLREGNQVADIFCC
ncbi:hypothetical protein HKD37_13G036413 [Glycine soja]